MNTMVYEKPKGTGRATYRVPSTHNLLSFIKQSYPAIVDEARAAFIPCKYPLDLIDKIRDVVYDRYGTENRRSDINPDHIIYGTVVLMYSRYPVGSIRAHYLHEGALSRLANVVGDKLPNASDYADTAASWLHTGCYEGFRECCEQIRDAVINQ